MKQISFKKKKETKQKEENFVPSFSWAKMKLGQKGNKTIKDKRLPGISHSAEKVSILLINLSVQFATLGTTTWREQIIFRSL